jgi:hypothetical protein
MRRTIVVPRALLTWRCFGIAFQRISSYLLSFEFLRQLTLQALPFSRLQKKRVFLNFLDNALLLNLALETPKGAFNGFTIENPDLGQSVPP